jgi:4,5-dihydroxyphthalate decarboxylase
MDRVSRRAFLTLSGLAVSSASATAQGAASASRASALTLTGTNYIRFLPIATGDVRPKDLALTWIRGERNEMLRRATDDPAVHGGETSMAQHVQRLDRGDRSLVAIPIFPLRNFTARDLYTRKGMSIAPGSLSGRRIGIYNWAASGAVWYRHLLRYLGNDTTKVQWVVGGVDGPATVRLPDPPLPYVTAAPEGKSLSALLLAGSIDALFAPLPPREFNPADGPIVRAFTAFQAMEQKYFSDTGCYPPQHVIVIRRAAWDRDRSAGQRLVAAFNESEVSFEALQRRFPYNSPWLIEEAENTARLLGPAYHAHGLDANRRPVDVFCQSAFDDRLTKRRLTVDEFFADFLLTQRDSA